MKEELQYLALFPMVIVALYLTYFKAEKGITINLTEEYNLGSTLTTDDIIEASRVGRPKDESSPCTLLVQLRKDTSETERKSPSSTLEKDNLLPSQIYEHCRPNDNYLDQLVKQPPRGKDKPTTLDLVLCINGSEIGIVRAEAPLGKLDHATITAELKAETKQKYNNENKLN
ncbi:hypothetical protein QYM36_009288 [Artemia franciscana]|uniref:Uncharacterized protein n=1 Tax=Artemia franciscana TaxID=6661 RepID=A0AA88L9N2_ARTSF|nr:hypothetical protein QYM36_009288 [Artemia franciscana]